MLVINSIGEPLEYCTAEVTVEHDPLWRPEDALRRAQGGLVAALFKVCENGPRIVFALASEFDGRVLGADVRPSVPACRLVPSEHPTGAGALEESATASGPQLIWAIEKPESGTPARRLLNRLIDQELLLEPFGRVEAALREPAV